MRLVKRILVFSAVFFCFFLLASGPASADDKAGLWGLGKAQQSTEGGIPATVGGAQDMTQIIGRVIGVGLSFLGIIFFSLVLYAGIRWMMAMGNTEDVQKAKTILETAAVGLALVLAAYAFANFLFSALGSK